MPVCNLIIDKTVNSVGLQYINQQENSKPKIQHKTVPGDQKNPTQLFEGRGKYCGCLCNYKGFQQFGQNHSPVSGLQS